MKPDLKKRIQKTQEEARARIAKRGVMKFRCTENDILRLNEFAAQSGLPVGAMMRKWVLERLEVETDTLGKANTARSDLGKEMRNFDKRLRLIEQSLHSFQNGNTKQIKSQLNRPSRNVRQNKA